MGKKIRATYSYTGFHPNTVLLQYIAICNSNDLVGFDSRIAISIGQSIVLLFFFFFFFFFFMSGELV